MDEPGSSVGQESLDSRREAAIASASISSSVRSAFDFWCGPELSEARTQLAMTMMMSTCALGAWGGGGMAERSSKE